MRNKKYVLIAIFIFIAVFSSITLYMNLYTINSSTEYTTGFAESDEFVWEIKYIDHSQINESYFWESFTEFDAGAKRKIQFDCVKRIRNDTKWSIFYSIWEWTSEPFYYSSVVGLGCFLPIVPEPWIENTFWRLHLFTPCDKHLKVLFSSNPNITFHNNTIWFNVSNYTIERTFNYSTGILDSYRIYFNNSLVFLSELL